MLKNKALKNYLHLHFIIFVWGFTAILGSLISINTVALVWYRMGIASIIIGIYIYFAKIDFHVTRKTLIILFLAGLTIALHWFTFFEAIKVSNVSITLACISTGAFFTSLLEPLFFKKKIIPYEVILGLIVVLGLYLMFKVNLQFSNGIILALLSSLLSAGFSIINGKLAPVHNPTVISFYELVGGTFFFSLFILINKSFTLSSLQLTWNDVLWLGLLSTVCTAYAFIASVHVMRYLSPYTVMLTTNLEPVYGILLALLLLGEKEKMQKEFYIGALVILATVVINGILKNKSKKSS